MTLHLVALTEVQYTLRDDITLHTKQIYSAENFAKTSFPVKITTENRGSSWSDDTLYFRLNKRISILIYYTILFLRSCLLLSPLNVCPYHFEILH